MFSTDVYVAAVCRNIKSRILLKIQFLKALLHRKLDCARSIPMYPVNLASSEESVIFEDVIYLSSLRIFYVKIVPSEGEGCPADP